MKRAIKIFAGIGGVVLIIILVVLTMSFTGNPISKVLATRSADAYIDEKYPDLELMREETYYEFKRGNYIVEYRQVGSKDIHFGIGTDHFGRITDDGYEEEVRSKWNTRERLNDELNDYVNKILRDHLDYDFDMILADTFGDEENEERVSELEIDMIFDLENIPLDQYLSIYIYEEDRSLEKLSEVLLEVDALMEANNLNISKYSMVLVEPMDDETSFDDTLGVQDFPKEDLDAEDLIQRLEEEHN